MGFWNKVGRWFAWAVGLLFVLIGFNALWHGLDIIQVERGWTGVIAGTTAMSAGALIILITLLIDRVDALRMAVLTQRALQVAEGAPIPGMAMEPEPPKPIEVPVEPPPAPTASIPGGFSFRAFGKKPMPVEEAQPEAAEPPRASPAAEPEIAPEPVRRFAPPQFRRPSVAPLMREPEPPPAIPESALPEVERAPEPAPVEVQASHIEISVEASITEAIAEELRLPRTNAPTPAASETEERAQVEPPPQAPEPAREPVIPPRGIAQTHEWLEKSLSGEESEPALDWLRQRRATDERSERKVPSFMRRHVEAEGEPTEAPNETPSPEPASEPTPEPAATAGPAAPAILGRYSANGSDYTLYADGSIDAQTPEGPRHFGSMEELRSFLQRHDAPTEG